MEIAHWAECMLFMLEAWVQSLPLCDALNEHCLERHLSTNRQIKKDLPYDSTILLVVINAEKNVKTSTQLCPF